MNMKWVIHKVEETKDFIGKSCGTFCRRSIQTATRTMLRDFRALGPHILPTTIPFVGTQSWTIWNSKTSEYENMHQQFWEQLNMILMATWTGFQTAGLIGDCRSLPYQSIGRRDDVILTIPEVNMMIIRLYSLRHNLFQPSFKPALSLPPRWDLTEDGVGLGKMALGKMMRKEVSMGKKGGGSKVCAMTLLWNQVPWHSVEFTCKPCKLAQTFEALGSPRWFLWYSTDWFMFRVSVCLFLGSTIASLWLTTTYQFVINYVFCDGKT